MSGEGGLLTVLGAAAELLAGGEVDAAVAALFSAWSKDPGNLNLAISYASLLAQAGRESEAEDLFSTLADESPRDGRVWNNWGYLLLARGEADLALAKLGRALELAPDDFEATVNSGIALDKLGRTAEAIDCHRRATLANPDSPVAFNNLGAALWRAGRGGEALAAFRRALELNPRDSSAANNLGVVKMASGDFAGAEEYFRQAKRFDPDSVAAKRNLAAARRGLKRGQPVSEEEKCREKPPSLF
jgi:Flp pilus assembly protein TadD